MVWTGILTIGKGRDMVCNRHRHSAGQKQKRKAKASLGGAGELKGWSRGRYVGQ